MVFVIKQLQNLRWIQENSCGIGPASIAGWTKRGINRLSLLGEALKSNGIGDVKGAAEWMRHQFAVGFFPPGNDPATESWLGYLEELGITEQRHALTLVRLVAGECFPKSGKMKEKLVMEAVTV
jgi:hypothetical protein